MTAPIIPEKQREKPLLSIITVVFNGIAGIEDTILSVIERVDLRAEYIIIDGGSTDGTLDIIKKYESRISIWVSEPDKGIYDALNKGINIATGYYIYTLNIGDKLIYYPVTELLEAKENNVDVVLFNVQLTNGKIFKSRVDFTIRFANTVHHQGACYKKDVNNQYNLSYRIFADFDFNQKLYKQGRDFTKYEKVISVHSLDGISNDRKFRKEYFTVIKNNFGHIAMVIGILYVVQGEWRMRIKKSVTEFFRKV